MDNPEENPHITEETASASSSIDLHPHAIKLTKKQRLILIGALVFSVFAMLAYGLLRATTASPNLSTPSNTHSILGGLLRQVDSSLETTLVAKSKIVLASPTPTATIAPTPTPTPRTTPSPSPRTTSTPSPTASPTATPNPTTQPTATPIPPTGLASGLENTTSFSPRVLVIGYNPTENGIGLADRYFTNSQYPSSTAIENAVFNSTRDSFSSLSNGSINFNIVKTMHITSFPTYPDGSTYTLDSYRKCVYTNPSYDAASCEQKKWQFDYGKWVKDNAVCETAQSVNADEIWVLSPPYIMAWEAFMIGPNSGFDVNGANYSISSCNKHYIVMDASYDRPENMLHDIGHRVEATMRYLTQNWRDEDTQNYWERFAALKLYNGQPPSSGYCGNAHYPSNTGSAYEYTKSESKPNTCSDWSNFPDFTGSSQFIGCSAWGCNDAGWQKYWLASLPHSPGKVLVTNKQGKQFYFLKNWWVYLLYPENAISARQIM